MYEEVEIKTPLDLARYLVNEGDLYLGTSKERMTIRDKGVLQGANIEFIPTSPSGVNINGRWSVPINHTFYKKLNWHDRIPEGRKVSCYVSNEFKFPDVSNSEIDCIGYTIGAEPQLYVGQRENWKYATPIPADELWVPEL